MTAAAPLVFTFRDPPRLADALAEAIAGRLRQRIAEHDQASLVVSGGTTPLLLFARLRTMDLPWEKVWITLADERWVDSAHDASNERLVRSRLLQDRAEKAIFIPLKNNAETAENGEEECCRALRRIPRPFAAVVLGMGPDGHTASLFPGAARLAEALVPPPGQDCLAMRAGRDAFSRMTLSLPTLLQTGLIFLHVTGQDKKRVLEQALAEGPVAEMPVRAILRQQQTPVHIYWSA